MIKAFKILIFIVFCIITSGCSSSSQIDPLDDNLVFDEEPDFADEVDDLDFSDLDSDTSEEFSLDGEDSDNDFEFSDDADSVDEDDFASDFNESDDDVSFDDFDESASVEGVTEEDDISFDDFDEAEVATDDSGDDDISFDDFEDVGESESDDISFDDFDVADNEDLDVELDFSADEEISFDTPQDSSGAIAFDIPSSKGSNVERNSSDSNQVKSIDYFNEVAGGAFSIETSKMPRFKTEFVPDTKQFVLTLLDAQISKKLNRPFLTKDFKQSFKSMSSYQDDQGDVRFVFKLSEGVVDQPKIVTEENGVVVRVVDTLPTLANNNETLFNDGETSVLGGKNPLGEGVTTLDDLLLNKIDFTGRPISIQAKNEEVVNIINFISEDVGANIIVSDTVKGTISLKLNQVPWDQALVVIMKAKGLGYVRNGNVLRVASIDELKKEALAAEEVAKANEKFAPYHVKVFPLSYAKPGTVEEKIKPFLTASQGEGSPGGQVISEERSSSLIIRDRLDVIKNIAKLIQELDQPPLQVMIRAKIVEANKNFERELGSRFNIGFNSSQQGSGLGLSGALNLNDTGDTNGQLNVLGLDFFGNLTQTLRLSELESNIRVLSSPSVMAINNEKATIIQSDEVLTPQILDQGGGTVTAQPVVTFQRDPVELRLEVTPQVSSDGNVIMDLLVKRQVPGEEQSGTRPISTREAQTKVIVGNNKTAMIGGVYQTRETGLKNGVPVLRKIPLIKWLFGREVEEKVNTELVIFVTPKVINSRGAQDPLNAKSKIKARPELTAKAIREAF